MTGLQVLQLHVTLYSKHSQQTSGMFQTVHLCTNCDSSCVQQSLSSFPVKVSVRLAKKPLEPFKKTKCPTRETNLLDIRDRWSPTMFLERYPRVHLSI